MFGLGPWEVAAILVVALLIFGNRLPSLARNAGKSLRGFKEEISTAMSGEDEEESESGKKAASAPKKAAAKAPAKKKTAGKNVKKA